MEFKETYSINLAFNYDGCEKSITEITDIEIEDGADLLLYEADDCQYR